MQNAIRPHHVGVSVSDLSRACAWYARAMGFEVQLDFTLPDGAQGSMLRSAGGARVELFEVAQSAAGLSGADPASAMRTRGFGHVAFEVDDLDTAYDTIVAAGGEAVWSPRPSPEPGRKMAFVHDVDGNLIELIGAAR